MTATILLVDMCFNEMLSRPHSKDKGGSGFSQFFFCVFVFVFVCVLARTSMCYCYWFCFCGIFSSLKQLTPKFVHIDLFRQAIFLEHNRSVIIYNE